MLPISLKVENFMSHSCSELKFDFNSALIVGSIDGDDRSSNGSGKTAIFEAISWVLFGKTKSKNSDDVIRRGQQICRAEFIFSHNDEKYRILRTRNIKFSKMELTFDRLMNDGTSISLTHDTNGATEAEIRNVIRSNFDVFINSSYFGQNMGLDFAEGTFSAKQALIGSLLNLDKWNQYQDVAKNELKLISDKYEMYKTKVEELSGLEAKLAEINELFRQFELQREAIANKEQEIEKDIAVTEEKLAILNSSGTDVAKIADLNNRIKFYTDTANDLESNISNISVKLDVSVAEFNKNKMELGRLDGKIIELDLLLKNRSTTDISSLEDSILNGKSKYSNTINQIDNLLNNEQCLLCGRPWDDFDAKQKEVSRRKEYMTLIETQLLKAEEKLKMAKVENNRFAQLEIELEKAKISREQKNNLANDYSSKVDGLKLELSSMRNRLSGLTEQISDLKRQHELIAGRNVFSDRNMLDMALNKAKKCLQDIRKEQNSISFKIGAAGSEKQRLETDILNMNDVRRLCNEASKSMSIYNKLVKIFGKDGIQAVIIDNVVDDLIRITNQWLAEFCREPTHINIITQKRNTRGEWRETFDIEVITPTGASNFESLSGGERFRVSFAIRLALSMLQAKRMGGEVQILLLDEVSTSLDASGLEVFINIIRKLDKFMKIMVITHDDKLKDEFDTVINVKKTSAGSYIEM